MNKPSRRPTLADVARRAGTSTAVVSYVINNGPRAVAPATKARVLQAIDDLGYRRNPLAGALSNGHSNFVGLIVPDTSNNFYGELSRHFEREGRRRGLTTLLGNTSYDGELVKEYVTEFSDLRPRGIFLTSATPSIAEHNAAPLIFVHSLPKNINAHRVRLDDQGGARTAVEHLFSHGYTDIHCFTGPHFGDPASWREEGWRQAMTAAGLAVDSRLHVSSFDRVAAERDARKLLSSDQRPRAIFTTTDEQALAVLRAAAVVGVRIPQDMALVSFDGIREARLGSPRITTMRAPMEAMASRAFDMLEASTPTTSKTQASEPVEIPPVVLQCELLIGETCGCTPGDVTYD